MGGVERDTKQVFAGKPAQAAGALEQGCPSWRPEAGHAMQKVASAGEVPREGPASPLPVPSDTGGHRPSRSPCGRAVSASQAEGDWGQERRSKEGDCPVRGPGEDSAEQTQHWPCPAEPQSARQQNGHDDSPLLIALRRKKRDNG